MLRIALPNKGRLSQDSRLLLAEAGYSLSPSPDRVLSTPLDDGLEAVFVRARDIPEFVATGAADIGITGWDLASEYQLQSGRTVSSRSDLGFGDCRLVVAVRSSSSIHSLEQLGSIVNDRALRVATVFPAITREFFSRFGISIELAAVTGASEIAPLLGIADVVVDITSTGSTLRTNGLREIATVMRSSARLIQCEARNPVDVSAAALEELVIAIESVTRARNQRYLMANMPRTMLDRLTEVLAVVPGLAGPTITNIAGNPQHVAIHAVVDSSGIRQTVARLREMGGEGILVTRIERLIP